MTEFLFSLLLVPLVPALENPGIGHAKSLEALEQRLNQGKNAYLTVPEVTVPDVGKSNLAIDPESLPPIAGRLFEWSNTVLVSEPANQGERQDRPLETMRLTGILESSGQRVAILNDGQRDHVVGVGSYVLDAYRVNSLTAGKVVLLPLDERARGKPLELNLMPGAAPGGLQ